MIPGFSTIFMMMAGELAEIEFIGSVASSTNSIAIPVTAQAGDLAVLVHYSRGSMVIPTGWEEIGSEISQGSYAQRAIRKTLTIGDPGASVTTGTGSGPNNILLVFRLSEGAWGTTESNNQEASSSPESQLISSGNPPYVAIALYAPSRSSNARGFDPEEDAEISQGTELYARYKIFNDFSQAVSVSLGSGGSNFLRSFRIGA